MVVTLNKLMSLFQTPGKMGNSRNDMANKEAYVRKRMFVTLNKLASLFQAPSKMGNSRNDMANKEAYIGKRTK